MPVSNFFLALCVILSFFTSTSAFNLDSNSLIIFFLFATLFIFFQISLNGKIINKRLFIYYLAFIFSVSISSFKVYYADIYYFPSPILSEWNKLSIIPADIKVLFKIIPLVIGGFFSFIALRLLKNIQDLVFLARSFLVGILICNFFGLYQWASIVFDIPYYRGIINHSIIHGDLSMYETPMRIASFTHEPSTFARFNIFSIILIAVYKLNSSVVFGKYFDYVLITIFFIGLYLSNALTALVGCIYLLFIFSGINFNAIKNIFIFIIFIVMLAGVMLLLICELDELEKYFLDLSISYSIKERLYKIALSIFAWSSAPIIGVGWDLIPSNDLLWMIFAFSGIFGFLCFLAFIFLIVKENLKWFKANNNDSLAIYGKAVSHVGVIYLLLSLLAGPDLYMGYPYIILLLVMSHWRVQRGSVERV